VVVLVLFIVFIIVAVTYFFLIVSILLGLNKTKTTQLLSKTFSTKVTVIIAARNEENNILNVLNDLFLQEFPGDLLEILIVDDGSADNTFQKITDFAAKNPSFPLSVLRIDLHDTSAGSKKSAIKLAVPRSAGDLILATDADTRMGKNWIASMVSYYEKYRPEMILGPVVYFEGSDLFSKIQLCEFMGLMAVTEGSCNLGRPLMCNGANLAYSRKAYETVGGFDDNLEVASGDDMFLMMKIRRKFGRNAVQFNRSGDAIVFTEPNKTFHEFLHQRLRWVSKNKVYKDPIVILVAGITYLFNAILCVGLVLGFFFHSFWILIFLLLAGKIIVEFPVLYKYAVFLGKTKSLKLIPLVQVLNIFYVIVIGFLGNFLSYRWKGKMVNPLKKS
jgi:cellulose synthase/poly-beta-1,6-N-acetylglucosamine synthase-like glycosyltransferase